MDRIVATETLHEGAQNRVAHQVDGKDLPVEFLATIKPRQRRIQAQTQKRFVELGWMHPIRIARTAWREMDRPGHIGWPPIATAIHQAAESPEEVPERNAGSQRIRQSPQA